MKVVRMYILKEVINSVICNEINSIIKLFVLGDEGRFHNFSDVMKNSLTVNA